MTPSSNSSSALAERLMTLFWRTPPATLAERARRRIALHLIPFLFFLYVLAYLDRVNVSVASLAMEGQPTPGVGASTVGLLGSPSGEGPLVTAATLFPGRSRSPYSEGLGFDRAIIGFGAGIFFWGYWILEIPSSISVVRWGARWVFVRILVLWGLCAALVGTIGTPFAGHLFGWLPHLSEQASAVSSIDGAFTLIFGWLIRLCGGAGQVTAAASTAHYVNGLHDTPAYQFYFFRFMLGFFEGGFFPSVIVYLSHWFRGQDRAKAIASFMAAIPLSSMLGMPISGLLLNVHWLGLPGWRWIFILEGVAPVLAGVATLFFLPDRPSKARWLPAEEGAWLSAELEREHQSKQGHGHWTWVRHLGMVLLLTVVYFSLNVSSYGLSMFMPEIIKSQTGLKDTAASCVASLPYVMALLAMLINGWHSDRTGERPWHVATPLALLSLSIWLAASLDGVFLLPALVMIFLVGTFVYAHLPAFWPIPTMFLGATTAASAIGFINMIGNLGGSVGPMVVGKVSTGQTSFASALVRIAPWPMAAAIIILVVGYIRRKGPHEAHGLQPVGLEETPTTGS